MTRTTEKSGTHRGEWPKTPPLPRAVRRMVFTLTLPSMLSGCAHSLHTKPSTEQIASASPSRQVFRVGPSKAAKQADAYAAISPDLDSSFSTTAIIEKILSRKGSASGSPAAVKSSAESLKAPGGRSEASAPIVARTRRVSQILMPAGTKTAARRAGKSRGDWASVRSRLMLSRIEHESVNAQIEEFQRHPEAVDFLMKRAEPYLRYLLEEIDRRGLPADLVLVPMVESAFETAALSPKQAAGIWQFIPSTGMQYGLQLTDTYDGRYDVHASTQAALKYLEHLHALFNGDWPLALAAYNAGEGAVSRAVEAQRKAGRTGGFWELDLPAETKAYVPKILALAHIIAAPESYGLSPRETGGPSRLTHVEVGPDVRIADVVATAGMPQEDFYRLNPAFKPGAQPPAQTYHLLMPADKAEALALNLPNAKVFATRNVIVKKGETLSILAKRHGVPELKLAEWNGLKPKTPLKAGQKLVVFPA
jgi:membrane-bound lytic murein transglycosylase D